MLFSGRDIWRNGAFAHGGFIVAPSGLDRDGLLLKVMLSGGLYRYDAQNLGGERVVGAEWLTNILPGWRIKRGNAEFKVFMGPEIQNHYLRPDDSANRLRGYSYGLRVAAEAWYEPTAETMIAADVSLSSIATSNSARAAYGWRVLEEMLGGIYFGPEVQYFGSDGYQAQPSRHAYHQHEDRRHRMVRCCRLGERLCRTFEPLCALEHSEAAVT